MLKKFTEFFFFDFVNISPIAFIALYCTIRLALMYGILADPVTIVIIIIITLSAMLAKLVTATAWKSYSQAQN